MQLLQMETAGIIGGIGFIVWLIVTIALFFLFRGIFLWYWKVNDIIKNQQEQIAGMNIIIKKLDQIVKNTKPEAD